MYIMFDKSVDWREAVSTLFYPCSDEVQLVILGNYKSKKQSSEGNGLEVQYKLDLRWTVDWILTTNRNAMLHPFGAY